MAIGGKLLVWGTVLQFTPPGPPGKKCFKPTIYESLRRYVQRINKPHDYIEYLHHGVHSHCAETKENEKKKKK